MVSIPGQLVRKDYVRKLASGIDPGTATPSTQLAGEIPLSDEHQHTTHLSVVDRDRMAVSMTCTLENEYGSRVVVPGGGFLLNDEMNDFGWLPGVTDATGRIGTPPNQVAPRKRMLSSMCPTIVLKGGKPVLVTGSPGGRTIINTVLCVVLNKIEFRMDLRGRRRPAATSSMAPRSGQNRKVARPRPPRGGGGPSRHGSPGRRGKRWPGRCALN